MKSYDISEFLLLPIENQKSLFNTRCITYGSIPFSDYPFLHAIRCHDLRLMKYFIDNGIDINFEMDFEGKPNGNYLEWAYDKAFLDGIICLLEHNVVIDFDTNDEKWDLINKLEKIRNSGKHKNNNVALELLKMYHT